jgi:hypothetical protein
MELQFHSGPACNGYQKTNITSPVTQLNAWKLQKMTVTAPHGAKSALVRLRVHKNPSVLFISKASDPFTALFDDVQVISKTVVWPGPYNPFPGNNNPDPTPTPNPDPTPAPQDDPDPTPAPQDEPDPTPAPQDEPDPTPAPQDEPDPTPAPQDDPQEPEDNGETVEEDVPGPAVPETPQDEDEDSSSDEPAGNGGSSDDGSDSESSDDQAEGTSSSSDEDESVGSDVQTLGGAEEKAETQGTKQSGKGGSPTPAAPEAGNASNAEEDLLGTTQLAVIGALVLTGLALAFLAGSRRSRSQDPRELPYE